jgi:hypothetical protein
VVRYFWVDISVLPDKVAEFEKVASQVVPIFEQVTHWRLLLGARVSDPSGQPPRFRNVWLIERQDSDGNRIDLAGNPAKGPPPISIEEAMRDLHEDATYVKLHTFVTKVRQYSMEAFRFDPTEAVIDPYWKNCNARRGWRERMTPPRHYMEIVTQRKSAFNNSFEQQASLLTGELRCRLAKEANLVMGAYATTGKLESAIECWEVPHDMNLATARRLRESSAPTRFKGYVNTQSAETYSLLESTSYDPS